MDDKEGEEAEEPPRFFLYGFCVLSSQAGVDWSKLHDLLEIYPSIHLSSQKQNNLLKGFLCSLHSSLSFSANNSSCNSSSPYSTPLMTKNCSSSSSMPLDTHNGVNEFCSPSSPSLSDTRENPYGHSAMSGLGLSSSFSSKENKFPLNNTSKPFSAEGVLQGQLEAIAERETETLWLLLLWINPAALSSLCIKQNAGQSTNQLELIYLLSGWMSTEWDVLKKSSLQQLRELCTRVSIDRKTKKRKGGGQEKVSSFLSILRKCLKPVLYRPSDRLDCATGKSHPVDLEVFTSPNLPTDMIREICAFLDPKSLHKLSLCNTYLRDCTLGAIPGLLLTLHPHQFTTVWWMLLQEGYYSKSIRTIREDDIKMFQSANPLIRQFQPCPFSLLLHIESLVKCQGSLTKFLNEKSKRELITGKAPCLTFDYQKKKIFFKRDAEDLMIPLKGGMLCDEPGLGKTISMIAVILKTLGTTPLSRVPEIASSSSGVRLRDCGSVSRRRSIKRNELIASKGTLVVIPDVLMDHWKLQINLHVSPKVLRKIYFDEDASHPLPHFDTLASCDVVVTTFKRLSNEWKNGRPLCSLDARKPQRYGDWGDDLDIEERKGLLSPLLKVYWLRMVIDEGHSLGKSSITNVIRMACTIECERRWILTGTPTPVHDEPVNSALLRHVGNILQFLRHEAFGRGDAGREKWKRLVTQPLEGSSVVDNRKERIDLTHCSPENILIGILSQVMIRHSKESIPEIPKPTWTKTKLSMNEYEKASYNAIVALAKANLVITGKDKSNPGPKHLDSLLNASNRKFLVQMLSNIRVASCGGGHTQLKLVPFESRREGCLQMLRDNNPFDEQGNIEEKISNYISDVTEGKMRQCEHCDLNLPLLLITPCGHLFCPECMNEMGDYCTLCQRFFSWETFQKLQPGFEASDYSFKDSRNGFTPHPDVAEAITIPTNDSILDNIPEEASQWNLSTKAKYLVSKIKWLNEQYIINSKLYSSSRNLIPKIIVFSQFSEFLDRLKLDFDAMKIKYAYFKGRQKATAINKFKNVTDIRVLLLTKEGSHGLDLSFVTHIFLMDSILDESVLMQVISRAYRMGSRKGVVIDQVMMKDTIEEVIFESKQLNANSLNTRMRENINEFYRKDSKALTDSGSDSKGLSTDYSKSSSGQQIADADDNNVSSCTKTQVLSVLHFLVTSLNLLRN